MRAKSIDDFAKFQLVGIGGSEMSALASLLMDGRVVANLDHPATRRLIQNIHRPVITYGPSNSADTMAREVDAGFDSTHFELAWMKAGPGAIRFPAAGSDNPENAPAPTMTALPLRVPFAEIRKARESFSSVEGRLERKGEKRGVLVIGNCAHHFTRIGAALRPFRRRRGLETGRKIP